MRSGFSVPRASVTIAMCSVLAACSVESGTTSAIDPELGVAASPQVVDIGETLPSGGGRYKVGQPYQIAGKWYEPREDREYDREGVASWYGAAFHGRLTANGEVFDSAALSAAHPTLPLPSYVRVTNLENERSVIVRVNDRGPFAKDRLIDVSERTAALLGFYRDGTTRVRVTYVDKAPLDGEDDEFLLASYTEPGVEGAASPDVMLAAAEPQAPAPEPAVAPSPPVVLASAASLPSPAADAAAAPTHAVAFTGPDAAAGVSAGAVEAAQDLAASQPADLRIAMTFQVIEGLE